MSVVEILRFCCYCCCGLFVCFFAIFFKYCLVFVCFGFFWCFVCFVLVGFFFSFLFFFWFAFCFFRVGVVFLRFVLTFSDFATSGKERWLLKVVLYLSYSVMSITGENSFFLKNLCYSYRLLGCHLVNFATFT